MYETMIRETLATIGMIGSAPRHVAASMRPEHPQADPATAEAPAPSFEM